MTVYRVDSKTFEARCVSDLCDDWLQSGIFKV